MYGPAALSNIYFNHHKRQENCDLSDFYLGMVVGARQVGLSIFITADLLGFLHTRVSGVHSELFIKGKTSCEWQFCAWKQIRDEERGQWRMARLNLAVAKVDMG